MTTAHRLFQAMDIVRSDLSAHESAYLLLQLLTLRKLKGSLESLWRDDRPQVALLHLLESIAQDESLDEGLRIAFDRVASFVPLRPEGLLQAVESMGDVAPEEICQFLASASQSLGHYLPSQAAVVLVAEILGDSNGRSVYVPFDESMTLAVELALRGFDVFAEVRAQPTFAIIQLLNVLLGVKVHIRLGDPVKNPSWTIGDTLRVFDSAAAFPPFNLRLGHDSFIDSYQRFPERALYGDVMHIRHMMAQASNEVVVAVANGLLFRTSAGEREFKSNLVEYNQLSSVVGLPGGMFHGTPIPSSLLVLNPGPQTPPAGVLIADLTKGDLLAPGLGRKSIPRFKDVHGISQALSTRAETDYSKVVTIDELRAQDYNLMPDRYVHSASRGAFEAAIEKVRTQALGDLVEFIRPQSLALRRSDEEAEAFYEISLQDLDENGLVATASKEVRVTRAAIAKAKQQSVVPDDLLLVVKGQSAGIVGLVSDSLADKRCIASQAFLVLRPRQASSPTYLLRYLRSPIAKEFFTSITGGTAMPMLQAKDVKAIRVVLPSLSEQREIERLHEEILESYNEIERLRKHAGTLEAAVAKTIVGGETEHGRS